MNQSALLLQKRTKQNENRTVFVTTKVHCIYILEQKQHDRFMDNLIIRLSNQIVIVSLQSHNLCKSIQTALNPLKTLVTNLLQYWGFKTNKSWLGESTQDTIPDHSVRFQSLFLQI